MRAISLQSDFGCTKTFKRKAWLLLVNGARVNKDSHYVTMLLGSPFFSFSVFIDRIFFRFSFVKNRDRFEKRGFGAEKNPLSS